MAVHKIQSEQELGSLERLAYGFGEVAPSLNVSTDTLARAAKTGALKTIRIAGRVLIPADEVARIARDGLQIRRGRPRKPRPGDPPGGNGGGAAAEARGQ